MIIDNWAIQYGVSREAVEALRQLLGAIQTDPSPQAGESEAAIQTRIRLEASQKGARLWRNNVGAGTLDNGSFVRWGIANDSKAMNNQIKSSDLIGIRPVLITPDMVGHTIGQFVAREVKDGKWKYKATSRECAQLRFMELVISLGGDACFANREGTL